MIALGWISKQHADEQRRKEQKITDGLISEWKKEDEAAPPRLDPVIEANCVLMRARSAVGIRKYGGTLDEMRYSERELIIHALQEALDLSNYLQAQLQRVDREAGNGK